ncbi:MAG TPA: ABC transporter ATP-binding protein [Candidatus Brocadiia bacterium]|nr:ABC transporter ATP-binding protein [Candidatus Brocadiia bacterium]
MENLVEIRDLFVRFNLKEGTVRAVNGVSLDIAPNRTIGVVGESGCGKTIMARTMMLILPPGGEIVSGSVRLAPREPDGEPCEIAALNPKGRRIQQIRGAEIAMIFQEPMTSLSPVHTVGNQIAESVRLHQKVSRREARDRAIEMLRLCGVPNAQTRVDSYPHELSGGLRQRSMIAKALSCRPRLLIADEPTTALDVTIQAQILNLVEKLQKELGMAVMMITHDLGVIAETADEVAVMYLGRIVEQAMVKNIFDCPKHPYTLGLLRSIPRIGKGNLERLASIPGSVPDPFTVLPGCPFHPRCDRMIQGACDRNPPPGLTEIEPGHHVACHLYDRRTPAGQSSGKAGAQQ